MLISQWLRRSNYTRKVGLHELRYEVNVVEAAALGPHYTLQSHDLSETQKK